MSSDKMGKAAVAHPAAAAMLFVGLVLAGAASCDSSANTLEGSIGERFSLAFDRVEINKQGLSLLIAYVQDASAGEVNITCKLVLNTEDLGLGKGKRVLGDTFLERTTIYRRTYPGGDFPAVRSGSIAFEVFEFEQGGRVDGRFDATFEDGYSLSGKFDGKVHVLSLD